MDNVCIVGAGIGGLASALRLCHAGYRVTVLERHGHVGGKMRALPSDCGPVDAGPTVLTMRDVFDDLFADVGENIDDHLRLIPQEIIARHWWPDGSMLDLHADHEKSAGAIRAFCGEAGEREWLRFMASARDLYEMFDGPVMRSPAPSLAKLTLKVLRNPRALGPLAPHQTLAKRLRGAFSDPRLAQLYGRYATYVGGSPLDAPAVLALIAHAEASGVWTIDGGMHKLARTIADLARARGADIKLNTHVTQIETDGARVRAVHTEEGRKPCDCVLFNGDPRALRMGLLGESVARAIPQRAVEPRSLSAHVWAFSATPEGPAAANLVHHNVFFGGNPSREFLDLRQAKTTEDPTLYVCAQDAGSQDRASKAPQRFEIIMNAPPISDDTAPEVTNTEEAQTCQTRALTTLAKFGLRFNKPPPLTAITSPGEFHTLFPASKGSLYGRSPNTMMSTFHRPKTRTRIGGLYLVGGGVHPGAGIPMATLCARHAVEAIMSDRTS